MVLTKDKDLIMSIKMSTGGAMTRSMILLGQDQPAVLVSSSAEASTDVEAATRCPLGSKGMWFPRGEAGTTKAKDDEEVPVPSSQWIGSINIDGLLSRVSYLYFNS